MAVVGDIYNALDAFCPFDVHEQWDNVGLLVGESSAQVTRAAVVLDITSDAVERAHEAGAQLIISHHPVIFHPIKNLGAHDPVYLLAKYGMNAICAHTNLDCADGGVNDVLAQGLKMFARFRPRMPEQCFSERASSEKSFRQNNLRSLSRRDSAAMCAIATAAEA